MLCNIRIVATCSLYCHISNVYGIWCAITKQFITSWTSYKSENSYNVELGLDIANWSLIPITN